jgi:peptide/nickel transport system ATP-binding protein
MCVRAEELPPFRQTSTAASAPVIEGKIESAVSVDRLKMFYRRSHGIFGGTGDIVRAVNDVELIAAKGRTLAIVGESGCGKSSLAKVLGGLETATDGDVTLGGKSVGHTAIENRPADLKRKLQMVFQNPDSTLNPSHTVGYAIGRALARLKGVTGAAARQQIERLLEVVKLPASFASHRPHQLSGGQKQRVAIARALAGDAEVIVADEPVSALDVSVQASIINLLNELQTEREATLIFISHDLAVVRYLADQVAVMYLGRIVEAGPVEAVFRPPFHPYTEALLSAVPQPDPDASHTRIVLEGSPPAPTQEIAGCPFASRCPRKVGPICDTTPPPEQTQPGGHRIACHIPVADLARLNATGVPTV